MNAPCEKCGHPRPVSGIGDGEIAAVLKERDRYRAALENIIKHQKITNPKIYELTVPYCIALEALDQNA